uniref:G protein-coupled receptor 149 n=1 Tax=Latimeria chalumnae TaxID=7897 RepID=H3B9I3_LATCH
MSVTSSFLSINKTSISSENHSTMEPQAGQKEVNIILFCVTFIIALLTLSGSVYSLISLQKMRNKTPISVIVVSLSLDDLLSVVAVSIFLFMQLESGEVSSPLCSTAAVLYLLQGMASNLKASLIASYNYYTTKKLGLFKTTKQKQRIIWAIVTIWIGSLSVSILPLFGWGAYVPTSWGCLADYMSSYVLFLFALYSLCVCILTVFSVPLTYQLLCSDDQQQCFYPSYQKIARRHLSDRTVTAGNSSPLSPEDPVDKTFRTIGERSTSSEVVFKNNKSQSQNNIHSAKCSTAVFAQKRFSLILAMVKITLWLPMMIQMVVFHVAGFMNTSVERLTFVLSLLAAVITPLFVFSERWIHLPCGCIINCRRNVYTVSSEATKVKKKGFEFNLSFQQGYGIYKISQAGQLSVEKSLSYRNLMSFDCETPKECRKKQNKIANCAKSETVKPKKKKIVRSEIKQNLVKEGTGSLKSDNTKIGIALGDDSKTSDKSTLYESQDRRLSHEEGHKPELSDWEWCRSKSERAPKQRSGGSLAIPLCAFQGTVSLHAPTGKTLSLSTYEISSEGQKLIPAAKKIDVYRSKSVGHEPNMEESPTNFADTNVKIHLEVLEICDNEEAMDTVSIISNISQSSAHARSPSLRYSRRENRFVSCDLGETASYSLFIPTNNPDSGINISIPDTVEAHRQNSKKQFQDRSGYQEEIQLLNTVYRKREGDGDSS